MIPGEINTLPGEIEINSSRVSISITVANSGDRPVQVGSHYHFAEVNNALIFDRKIATGMRLDIAAGTAKRFEPGQSRTVFLIPISGKKRIIGFNREVMGDLS